MRILSFLFVLTVMGSLPLQDAPSLDELFPNAGADSLILELALERRQQDGTYQPVSWEDALRTGDRVRLQVRCNRGGYLRLLWVNQEGKAEKFWPGDGDSQPIYPGSRLSIGTIRLSKGPATERFRLQFSSESRPLKERIKLSQIRVRNPELEEGMFRFFVGKVQAGSRVTEIDVELRHAPKKDDGKDDGKEEKRKQEG